VAAFTPSEVVEAASAEVLAASAAARFASVSTDSRTLEPGALFVALEGERFDGHGFLAAAAERGAAGAVVRRGKPLSGLPPGFGLFAVEHTLRALGALARFHRRRFPIPLGAVGGSNGKTTTKEMTGSILAGGGPSLKTEGNLNNEVGLPLTLLRLTAEHRAAVVELGMNAPGEMARLTAIAEPGAGLLTTVQAEHTEFLGNLEGVARAEGELFRGLDAGATAVVNLDEPLVVQQAGQSRARWLTFGRSASAEVQLVAARPLGAAGQEVELRVDGRTHTVPLAFLGPHNALHAAGAWALGRALGFAAETCAQGLARAQPVERRLNVLQAPGGLTILDDCYNANPSSMAAALQTARELAGRGRVVAVLGDMLELGAGEAGEHERLAALAAGLAEVRVFLGPRSQAAARPGEAGEAARFVDVDALWAWLSPRLAAGDVVLVKGSRGMRMERIVERLTGTPAPAAH